MFTPCFSFSKLEKVFQKDFFGTFVPPKVPKVLRRRNPPATNTRPACKLASAQTYKQDDPSYYGVWTTFQCRNKTTPIGNDTSLCGCAAH